LSRQHLVWAVLREPANLRFVVPILVELDCRGWEIVISFALQNRVETGEAAVSWARSELPRARFEPFALAGGDPGLRARALVAFRDLDSYVQHAPAWPPILRERWPDYLVRPLAYLVRMSQQLGRPGLVDNPVVRTAAWTARAAAPRPRALLRQLHRLKPDRVLVTPMLYPASREIDVIAAASRAGVPSVGLVLSWDNLSSKGSFHQVPDRVLVWNEEQRGEATSLHGLDPRRVEAIGAPVFDFLFERPGGEPARLPARPYVLYAVSSQLAMGPGGEVDVVTRLAAALRNRLGASAPTILVRPHPKNLNGWKGMTRSGIEIWADPGFPESSAARDELRGSLAGAVAVIGINTSVFIEAAIVGTPSVALIASEAGLLVAGTLAHFAFLRNAGFLHEVASESDAAATIATLLVDGEDEERSRARARFVQSFVRPSGVERPAAEAAADAIERADRPVH
jgi:hypothetical protein